MYGEPIKLARISCGLTQKQVSEITGIPQNTISWIELNKGMPSIEQCRLLAECYNMTIEELINVEKKDWELYKENNNNKS
ncbi:MAG: helix-turn-helix transcriptional regulator [Clostridia bacterium]|nr:helix-turn-helix transcriptional regulator [Clostridia bacterium]